MDLGTLGMALVVVVGVPAVTVGYALLTERLLRLLPERRRPDFARGCGWHRRSRS